MKGESTARANGYAVVTSRPGTSSCQLAGDTMRVTRVMVSAVPVVLLSLLFFPSSSSFISPSAASAETGGVKGALPDTGYVGAETCEGCHEDSVHSFAKTRMGRLFLKHPRDAWERNACENCHGPGKAHVDAGGGKGVGGMITFAKDDPTPVEKQNATCLRCHQRKARLFWKGSPHDNRGLACTSCHVVMKDVSVRSGLSKPTVVEVCRKCHLRQSAQQMYVSHMPVREGKMDCASCHNSHGTVTDSLLKANSLNDICYKCHADKRGPFLWEHPPVVESCANCHAPHGSNHEQMLVLPKPRLCQTCHIEARHPTEPHTEPPIPSQFIAFRGCVNCHYNIHGSNHPSGYRFTR